MGMSLHEGTLRVGLLGVLSISNMTSTIAIDREQSQMGVIARVRPLFHGSYEIMESIELAREGRYCTIGEGFVSFPDSRIRNRI